MYIYIYIYLELNARLLLLGEIIHSTSSAQIATGVK